MWTRSWPRRCVAIFLFQGEIVKEHDQYGGGDIDLVQKSTTKGDWGAKRLPEWSAEYCQSPTGTRRQHEEAEEKKVDEEDRQAARTKPSAQRLLPCI